MHYKKINIIIILFIVLIPTKFYGQEQTIVKNQIESSKILSEINSNAELLTYKNIEINGDLDFTSLSSTEERRTDQFGKKYYRTEINSKLYFENCIFNGKLIAYSDSENTLFDTIFNKELSFINCTFNNGADFTLAKFKKITDFSFSKLTKVNFYRTIFKGEITNFKYSTLEQTDFSMAVFYNDADFSSSTFKDVTFFRSKFMKAANFSNIKFTDKFWLSYYVYLYDFSRIEFNNGKDFSNVTLNGKAFDPSKSLSFFEYMIIILPELGEGLINTLIFTFVAMAIGFFLAIPLCTIRLYGKGVAKALVTGFVEVIRGTPLLIQLYLIYFGLPQLGLSISPYVAALIGFTINSTAYQIEYMKGGFKAISYDQIEAAHSLGMRKWQTVFRMLVPQGLRFGIPALSNELIYLLKYTSLGFIIQAPELIAKVKLLASHYARYMDTYLIAAFIYILLTFILTKITDFLDKKLRIPGFEPVKIR